MVTFTKQDTRVVELVDTPDLKSCGLQGPYGFDSRPGYEIFKGLFITSNPFSMPHGVSLPYIQKYCEKQSGFVF